jgi:hypothetical protein
MRRALLVAIGLALATTFQARAMPSPQTPPPAQGQKPEQKASASIAGKWDMTVETDQGQMQTLLEIKLDGKKVSGTLTGPQGAGPIEGEFADNKLTFSMAFDSPNGSMSIAFSATLKDDTFTGTLDFGQGQVPWHATRSKG